MALLSLSLVLALAAAPHPMGPTVVAPDGGTITRWSDGSLHITFGDGTTLIKDAQGRRHYQDLAGNAWEISPSDHIIFTRQQDHAQAIEQGNKQHRSIVVVRPVSPQRPVSHQ